MLTVLREATEETEKKLSDDLKSLQQQKEQLELTLKRTQWQMTDHNVEKTKEIEKLKETIASLQHKFGEEMETCSKTIVAKDVELESLKSSEDRLRKDANTLKSSVERLKKDLVMATDRERILENAKVQLELDWRRRYWASITFLIEKIIRN